VAQFDNRRVHDSLTRRARTFEISSTGRGAFAGVRVASLRKSTQRSATDITFRANANRNIGLRITLAFQTRIAFSGGCVMGLFTKDIKTMDDLFLHVMQDIYYAENQIVKSLPDMIEKATDASLKQGFQTHLGETKNQIKRLEQVFKLHGVEILGIDCPAIDGILEEADEVAGEVDDKNVLDAALIAAAQAVEHYEMTRYGTLIAWAKLLGRADCARLLEQNLQEEKAADSKLTALAESNINRKAA
jgi:ferritin-like metal-binding protein YciE